MSPEEKAVVTLREYVETLIGEFEKRSDAQFKSVRESLATALIVAEKASQAAMVAQDKQTTAAFTASKEALIEAQVQLTAYKAQSNEWRATLNDLITRLMMRPEVLALVGASDKAISDLRRYMEDKFDQNTKRIAALELALSKESGRDLAQEKGQWSNRWNFSQIVSILALILSAIAIVWHVSK